MNNIQHDRSEQKEAGVASSRRERNPDALVAVAETAGELTAEVIQGRLESANIPSALQYESMGTSLFPVPSVPLGRVRVLVPPEFAAEALALLSAEVDLDDTFNEEDDVMADVDDAS